VELSLLKRTADGNCRWWTGSAFRSRRCGHAVWFYAKGRESWTYALPSRLPRTADSAAYYRLRSRAIDRLYNAEVGHVAGVNESVFEVE
jgi:hypothetical protein